MAVTETWPTVLPLPTFAGYGLKPDDAVRRTEMESGPARQRVRFTQVPTTVSVRWRFSLFEFGVFQSWFRYKGKSGGAYFNMDMMSGLGLSTHEARFKGSGREPYSATLMRGTYWIVTSQMEVRALPTFNEEELDLALAEDIEGLLAACASYATLINQGLPQNPW